MNAFWIPIDVVALLRELARTTRAPKSSRCVTVEDKVARVDDLMAGKAGVVHRLAGGFAIVKVSEPPAAGRGVFSCVLDHELNPVLGWPGHERLETAKGFATFLQRVVTPGEPGNDGAVRERKCPFPGGLDRYVVAQNGAQIVEVAFFVGDGDQPPVAVSGWDFDSEDRGGLSVGLSRCGSHVGDHAGQRHNCNRHEHNPSHTVSPSETAKLASSQAIPSPSSRPGLAERSEGRAD